MTVSELETPPAPASAGEAAAIPTDPRYDEVVEAVPVATTNTGRLSSRELVGILPGLAAVGLGVLYATGALVKTAQLREAGIRVGDALPLVPIEQILALGIGTMVQAFFIVVFWALSGGVWVYIAHRNKKKGLAREPDPPPAWAIKHRRLINNAIRGVFTVFVLVSLTQVSVFATIAALAPAWLFFGPAGREVQRGNTRGLIKLWVTAYSIVVIAKIGGVWYHPMPLPTASVQTRDAVTEGPLIAAKGDAWYVARPDGKSFEAIPTARMISADVESPEPPDDDPALPLPWP